MAKHLWNLVAEKWYFLSTTDVIQWAHFSMWMYYRTNSSWRRPRLKKGTAQWFRLTNSARISINLIWYDSNIYIIYESWVRESSCDSRYARKLDFSYYDQIWKFGPRNPENEFFRKFLIFMERSLNFASNELSTTPQTLSLSQVMQENLILACYAQIWKFGPRPPENDFFRKFLIFMERSLNFGSNKPLTTPRH